MKEKSRRKKISKDRIRILMNRRIYLDLKDIGSKNERKDIVIRGIRKNQNQMTGI